MKMVQLGTEPNCTIVLVFVEEIIEFGSILLVERIESFVDIIYEFLIQWFIPVLY